MESAKRVTSSKIQFSHLLFTYKINIDRRMSYKEIQRCSFKENMRQASCSSLLSANGHCGQPKKEPQFPTSGSPHISPSWRFDEESMVG